MTPQCMAWKQCQWPHWWLRGKLTSRGMSVSSGIKGSRERWRMSKTALPCSGTCGAWQGAHVDCLGQQRLHQSQTPSLSLSLSLIHTHHTHTHFSARLGIDFLRWHVGTHTPSIRQSLIIYTFSVTHTAISTIHAVLLYTLITMKRTQLVAYCMPIV